MLLPSYCIERAESCARQGRETDNPDTRHNFWQLEQSWRNLAEHIQRQLDNPLFSISGQPSATPAE